MPATIEKEVIQLFLTKNNCYISGKRHKPAGVMYHSTGANNPKLSRYVGPDDGILGPNPYNNHWNQPRPGGANICAHGFIGKDKNGKVRLYQTLPWDMVGWLSGSGSKGSAGNANNTGYIGIEICEDALNDKDYFMECIDLLNRLTAYLSKKYSFAINNKTVVSHSEGYKLGIASNHSDIEHWSKRFGYTMDHARAEVLRIIKEQDKPPALPPMPKSIVPTLVDNEILGIMQGAYIIDGETHVKVRELAETLGLFVHYVSPNVPIKLRKRP